MERNPRSLIIQEKLFNSLIVATVMEAESKPSLANVASENGLANQP
jgi:hypothetical protein